MSDSNFFTIDGITGKFLVPRTKIPCSLYSEIGHQPFESLGDMAGKALHAGPAYNNSLYFPC